MKISSLPQFDSPTDFDFTSVVCDSRQVSPGAIFVAIKGAKDDGARHIGEALQRGAVAVISEDAPPKELASVPFIQVASASRALAELACEVCGRPSNFMKVFAVTGTNGKTTVAGLVRDSMEKAGARCGLVSTVEVSFGNQCEKAARTTPDAPTLQRKLSEMLAAGCAAVSIEASSHALVQNRTHATRFAAVAFTNLSRDHFDYHHDFENYFEAKKILFKQAGLAAPSTPAIINADDEYGCRLLAEASKLGVRPISYSICGSADYRAEKIVLSAFGTQFTLRTPRGDAEISSGLLGRYNVSNMLCAAAMAIESSVPLQTVCDVLNAAKPRWGRLEKITEHNGASVFVDYAHTPDAIEKTLTALREITANKLIIVFGCGGDRDRAKRPQMGQIASNLADVTVLTSDNPRTEDPESILDEIKRGICGDGRLLRFVNRRDAISAALSLATPGDCIVIAGKGHETTQEIMGLRIDCDDRAIVRSLTHSFLPEKIAQWLGVSWICWPEKPISGFSFDSRNIRNGDIFVALRSDSADGNAYVEDAMKNGASGAIVDAGASEVPCSHHLPILPVENTRKAFQKIASEYRREVGAFVIGITGSVGKSTVKEWTAALLATEYATASTIGNFNNDIGLPASLLRMPPDTEAGVFEIGMNHKGELAPLCAIMRPDAAIITAIAPAHIENFASIDEIADEKAELIRAVGIGGFVVLDMNSPWFDFLSRQSVARVVTVGIDAVCADYAASEISIADGAFLLSGRAVETPLRVKTGIPGEHNILNALYAIAAARSRGVSWMSITQKLSALPTMKMRWEKFERGGIQWINDAYNANPAAMASALKTFSAIATGRRVYVLGEMRELGRDSQKFHAQIGSLLATLGGEVLIGVGIAGKWIVDAALAAGFAGEVFCAPDVTAVRLQLASTLKPGDSVLLKASRGVALERVL